MLQFVRPLAFDFQVGILIRYPTVNTPCLVVQPGAFMVTAPLSCSTGASHASHLGCPSAYGSRVSYVKKRQV